jgi:hypothetical protein
MNALSPDAARLKALRASFEAVAPADWTRVHGETAFVEVRGEMGEVFVMANFTSAATVDEIEFVCNAPEHVGFLLRLLTGAFREIRALRGLPSSRQQVAERGEPAASDVKNFAAECAMKCKDDPSFRVFLHEMHGLEKPLTTERVEQRVRSILGVQSRKELNKGGAPSEAWKALRASFAKWLKARK